jgi:hypothetical protein
MHRFSAAQKGTVFMRLFIAVCCTFMLMGCASECQKNPHFSSIIYDPTHGAAAPIDPATGKPAQASVSHQK